MAKKKTDFDTLVDMLEHADIDHDTIHQSVVIGNFAFMFDDVGNLEMCGDSRHITKLKDFDDDEEYSDPF